jgi:hypothetical protein
MGNRCRTEVGRGLTEESDHPGAEFAVGVDYDGVGK